MLRLIASSHSLKGSAMGFTICYTYRNENRVLELSASKLIPHDAVCYALFDSPADVLERPVRWEGSYSTIVEYAERLGVSNVRWHQSISHPHHRENSEAVAMELAPTR
jgi:hypothetical protein